MGKNGKDAYSIVNGLQNLLRFCGEISGARIVIFVVRPATKKIKEFKYAERGEVGQSGYLS